MINHIVSVGELLKNNGFIELINPEEKLHPKENTQFKNDKCIVIFSNHNYEVVNLQENASQFTKGLTFTALVGILIVGGYITTYNSGEETPAKDPWISVDILPPNEEQIIGYYPNKSERGLYVDTAALNGNNNKITGNAGSSTSAWFRPTLWQPMPKVPAAHKQKK